MIRKNQMFLNILNMASDFFLIFLSYPLAMYTRLEVLRGESQMPLLSLPYYILAGSCALLAVFIYYILGMYSSQRLKQNGGEIFRVSLVNGIVSLGAMALLYLIRIVEFPRLAVVLFWLFSSLLVIAKHTFGQAVLRHYRSLGYNQKRIAIVGNGHLAKQYLESIQENPQLGIKVMGYISKAQRPELGVCLGSYEELEKILVQHKPDELIVALEPH